MWKVVETACICWKLLIVAVAIIVIMALSACTVDYAPSANDETNAMELYDKIQTGERYDTVEEALGPDLMNKVEMVDQSEIEGDASRITFKWPLPDHTYLYVTFANQVVESKQRM